MNSFTMRSPAAIITYNRGKGNVSQLLNVSLGPYVEIKQTYFIKTFQS